jgi:hypothetical protein
MIGASPSEGQPQSDVAARQNVAMAEELGC